MKLKSTMLAVLAGTAAMVSLPVLADNGWHGGQKIRTLQPLQRRPEPSSQRWLPGRSPKASPTPI